jgi:hypothetical protein
MMTRPFAYWLIWFCVLLVIDIGVPFTLLQNTPTIAGSFTFWLIWGLVAIFSMLVMMSGWRAPADGDRAAQP